MKYYRYLYVSPGINHVDKIKTKLKLHKGVIGIYVISLSSGNDQLEIMSSYYLKLKYYRKHPPVVVGLAESYDSALELVLMMQNEAIEHTGQPSIKEYLIQRAKTKDFTKELC